MIDLWQNKLLENFQLLLAVFFSDRVYFFEENRAISRKSNHQKCRGQNFQTKIFRQSGTYYFENLQY